MNQSSHARLLLVLSVTLWLAACSDAQKPYGVSPVIDPASSIKQGDGRKYSEPALIGKVIDHDTQKPVQGAFVYGFYATATGTKAGGSKFGEHVKSFLVETDANGQFKLEAWDTGDRAVQGEPSGKFPMIAIYKPGYDADMIGLNSIRQWRPTSYANVPKPVITDTVIDMTQTAHEMRRLKTEKERYDALSASSAAMMMVGECGWETYAPLLLAQHDEKKTMIRRTVERSDITNDGYLKSGRPHPMPFVDFLSRTSVDQLTSTYGASPSTWKCSSPKKVFSGELK